MAVRASDVARQRQKSVHAKLDRAATAAVPCAFRSLEIERTGRLDRPRAQERPGAAPAIRDGLEGNSTGRAACRPAIDASEVIGRPVDVVRASTSSHETPPWAVYPLPEG